MPLLVDGDALTLAAAPGDPTSLPAAAPTLVTPGGSGPRALAAPTRPRTPRATHRSGDLGQVAAGGEPVLSATATTGEATSPPTVRSAPRHQERGDRAVDGSRRRPRDAAPTDPDHPRPDPPLSDGPPPVERSGLNQPPSPGEPVAFPIGGVGPHPVGRVAREPMPRICVCNDAGEPTTSPD